ncbi:MAG: TPM domain-containing protein [Alphaproteobacteria bacterium]|nr:TPM domain-containing protein [Alphaproteobacteria bacterium]MDE2113147.1 TPM domain-containing protein [Alphaproteobacteria bacterium]MDE2494018.1 TPM domain-containing protein [Alphaproteobacteria bacterium]
MTGSHHLSAEQRTKLHAACEAAEARTHARFVLVTMHVSDRYALYPLVYGAVLGFTALGALALFWPELSLRPAFFAAAAVFAVASLVLDWLPLRLRVVPKRVKHAHARTMAHHAFAARVLAQNDHKPGIVFFVSLGERYVEVVTDRDVDKRIPQKTWDGVIAEFAAAAKAGRITDGFLAAVESCTKVLEMHYPKA